MGTDWTDSLKTIDLDAIRPMFDWQTGHETDARRQLQGNHKIVARTERQLLLDARRLNNAVAHVGRLPEPGEQYHLVSGGQYSLFHILQACLKLAAPVVLEYLAVCTLGFSSANIEELAAMLDRGQVKQLDFIFSLFFKSNEKEISERLTIELTGRGARVLSMRCHMKLLAVQFADGRAIVAESSANLRSSANIEQTVLSHNADLLTFYRTLINTLFHEEPSK